MPFNTGDFAFFFVLVFALYRALPLRGQNRLLLVASYFFYGFWDWRFAGLLLLSTVVDYTLARAIEASDRVTTRKRLIALSLGVNLGILGCFKYAEFFADSLHELLARFGAEAPDFALDIALPVGISFYTFQSLAYTIDVYRGRLPACRSLPDFALYIAFFPQLVAGPIERAAHLLPQFTAPRRLRSGEFGSGGWLILSGLFKKAVIADNLATLVDAVFLPGADPQAGEILIAAYAFTFQIYCDFSGYSDMARGIARLLGFDLMLNFDRPLGATNITEFWRRWHISLSTWLRDYLYIPLGGNREGVVRTYRNLLLTMLLGGLWHGAAWTFVAWGGLHGAALCLHRALAPRLPRLLPPRVGRALGVLVTFHFVVFAFTVFRADSLAQWLDLLGRLAIAPQSGLAPQWSIALLGLTAPLLALEAAQTRCGRPDVVESAPLVLRSLAYALCGFGLLLLGEDGGNAFIYFQF